MKYRVYTDSRHLNAKLADDRFPIPILRTLLDLTSGSPIFTSLDLAQSYHQFFIKEENQQKTSFTCKNTLFMFSSAPFGLKVLTSVFQRVIKQIFSDLPFVINFVNDILIFSSNLHALIPHLKITVERITNSNLTFNVSK